MKKYAIWNNKGGVGKTTLTYLLSTEYARKNPECNVVVVDMCPQTNVSEMLLGGNGRGEENLEECYRNDKSIAGYIKARYDRGRFSRLGSESNYFIPVKKYNEDMPVNLYLLPGDSELDLCGRIIDYLAGAPEKRAWHGSRAMLISLIDSFEQANNKIENIFFIDCNPSFNSYTELAILGSNRLIIPCTADAASIRGVRNILRMVFGVKNQDSDYPFNQFSSLCRDNGFDLPKIHSIIQNKSRSYLKDASSAFQANIEELARLVSHYHNEYPGLFLSEREVLNIKDGNTIAAVLNHTGFPLYDLKPQKYEIYGMETQVNKSQKESLLEDLDKVIDTL